MGVDIWHLPRDGLYPGGGEVAKTRSSEEVSFVCPYCSLSLGLLE